MTTTCSKCSEPLASDWAFCARCGTEVPSDAPATAGHEHEPTPVAGAFSGALFGLIAAPIGLVFGIMLCLTGWGIFIGIPVIVLSMLAPLAGPLLGLGAAKDKVL